MKKVFKLNVPYREKDEAKKLGAKWNFKEKYWYCEGEEILPGLSRWYHEATVRTEVKKPDTDLQDTEIYDQFAPYKTVSQVNDMILQKYYMTKEFSMIMVKGEVTNYNGNKGGHYYFAIKDEDALLPCVLWAGNAAQILKFPLEKGQQVAIVGDLDYYKGAGKTHLVVRRIVNMGDGAANLALLALKAKLQAEGLFDLDHKKPIPKHPKSVGIITSKDGQAIKDICKVAGKRNPYVQLVLFHVKVQGKDAVNTIVEGIKVMDRQGLDALIVGRGGGSDEELKAYNEEAIARAVYEARTPIVSAVGHEGHWTLIDYTADKRVATPSEAAEETIPDIMTELRHVMQLYDDMTLHMFHKLEQRKSLLNVRKATLEQYNPERILKDQKNRLELLQRQMMQNMMQIFEEKKYRYGLLLAQLNGLSPTAKLVKGFGYISKEGKAVTSVDDVKTGETLQIRIHDGEIEAKVSARRKKDILE